MNSRGLGAFSLHGQTQLARRVAYAHLAKIPFGMDVETRCGNKRCIRFDHLSLVSGKSSGKSRDGQKPRNPVPDTVRSRILLLRDSGKNYREIAMIVGLSENTVSRVVRGKR